MSDTIACLNADGLIEIIDIYSGKVLSVQSSREDVFKDKKERMTAIQQEDGSLIYVERGVSPDSFRYRPKWTFSQIIIDLICSKILEGQRMVAICREPGMPPFPVLAKWRREKPAVNEQIMQARSDYAEIIREQIIEEAMGDMYQWNTHLEKYDVDEKGDRIPVTPSNEWIAQKKLRIGALQWAAGVDSPDRFGSKTKVIGENTTTVHLIVDTGIRRNEDIKEAQKIEQGAIDGSCQSETNTSIAADDSGGSAISGECQLVEGSSGASGIENN